MMDKNHLREILEKHKQWLDGLPDGKRADLRRADLQGADLQNADLRRADLWRADLQYADLRGANLWRADLRGANLKYADLWRANLDFSCWPLWCGSLDVKVDVSIARQLAYHLCRLDCDDKEYLKVREAMIDFANQFHRAEECGEIYSDKTKKTWPQENIF